MAFDIKAAIDSRRKENFDLYSKYVNPWVVHTARRLGFDKNFVTGTGPYLFDDKGDRYLDLDAGSGVFVLGRNHPQIRDCMHAVLDADIPGLINRNPNFLAGLLGETLAERTPGQLNKAIFTNAGAETVEAALKFARKVTGRSRLIYLMGDYHGLSYGALSVTDTVGGNQWAGGGYAPMVPDCVRLPRDDLDALRTELQKEDVAGVIVEPIRGATVEALSDEYLLGAQELCRTHGSLLIVDEILVGLGRTGKLFYCDHVGLEPDLLLLSKALSGGVVPVGALMIRDDLHAKAYAHAGVFIHRSTFMENAFAMAAGLATIHVLEDEGLVERAAANGAQIVEGLNSLKEKYSLISKVRGYGMLVGIELQTPKKLTQKVSGKLLERKGLLGHMLMIQLMEKHRIMTIPARERNMLRIHPPFLMSDEDIRYFLAAFESVLQDAHRFPDGISQFLLNQLLKKAS